MVYRDCTICYITRNYFNSCRQCNNEVCSNCVKHLKKKCPFCRCNNPYIDMNLRQRNRRNQRNNIPNIPNKMQEQRETYKLLTVKILKTYCRTDYQRYGGFSYYTRKADLIEFMISREDF
jgi:hypothetical protein